ncbi:penicillin-binding protein 2 [Paenochrobactrum glaciei]
MIKHGSSKNRIALVISLFIAIYATIFMRLVHYGMVESPEKQFISQQASFSRPVILDRNGKILAMDITAFSLYAEPRRITDIDEVAEKVNRIIPQLSLKTLYGKLSSSSGFVWLARQLTPAVKNQLMLAGIPGIGFRPELKRIYPAGRTTAHIIGLTNVDNAGVAGLEKWIDGQGIDDIRHVGLANAESLAPVITSIDLRVQHALHYELSKALVEYGAAGVGGVILNIKSGEIIALASLPDFDPQFPTEAQLPDRLNRITASASEMGSIIKTFTTAMAIEYAGADLTTIYDATNPIKVGNQLVRDFFGKKRPLTLEEVFLYSSNIGSAHEALSVGVEAHRKFLVETGLLNRIHLELPEIAKPMEPRHWTPPTSITAAFGHGFATTPLQTAVGIGGILNKGILVAPTLLKRSHSHTDLQARRIVDEKASAILRHLYRLSAVKGSGRRANIAGLRVGGKTGTAEKVIDGRYAKNRNFNVFAAAMPMDDPTYVYLIVVDDPAPKSERRGQTAGLTAAPLAGEIIRKTFSFLNLTPQFEGQNI